MEIAPLALVMLLGYGLLIAVALTTWTAVAYFREEPSVESRPAEAKPTRSLQERQRQKRQVSNDDVRGARSRRARGGSDPFKGEGAAGSGNGRGPKETEVSGEAVSWTRDAIAPEKRRGASSRPAPSDESGEDDAFERFLSSRPDDFDIR